MTFIERPAANDPADPFTKMATRIAHNTEGARFGGAVVIVPPDGGGEPIEILFLDQAADAALFWSTVRTKITAVLEALAEKERQGGWQGRR
jgi:hypothetical protein